MKVKAILALASLAAVTVFATSASGSLTAGPPGPTHFKWGTFTLSSRIAGKVKAKQSLNFALSFQILNEPGAPSELRAGLKAGAIQVQKELGAKINTTLIGPPNTDPPTQIAQINQKVAANQVDCAGVEPVTPGAFVPVINKTMGAGVPMMTVNTDSPASHRIGYYGVNDADSGPNYASALQTGKVAGAFTVAWAKASHVNLNTKTAALVTGDTTASWAQGRMRGWVETVHKAFPQMKVVGSPTNAFTTGYIPADIFNKMSSFMTGHPQVSLYFSSDWEAAEIGQLIGQRHLKGKVFALGYNIDGTIVNDLKQGLILGTLDQRFDLQSQTFVVGCARYLLTGKVPGAFNFVQPSIWTPKNVNQAIALYKKIPNSGVLSG
jgi:ribose transport system substrate-binding protein